MEESMTILLWRRSAVAEDQHMAGWKKREANLQALLECMFRWPCDSAAGLALLSHRRDIVADCLERFHQVVALENIVWYGSGERRILNVHMVVTLLLFEVDGIYGTGQQICGSFMPDIVPARVLQGILSCKRRSWRICPGPCSRRRSGFRGHHSPLIRL